MEDIAVDELGDHIQVAEERAGEVDFLDRQVRRVRVLQDLALDHRRAGSDGLRLVAEDNQLAVVGAQALGGAGRQRVLVLGARPGPRHAVLIHIAVDQVVERVGICPALRPEPVDAALGGVEGDDAATHWNGTSGRGGTYTPSPTGGPGMYRAVACVPATRLAIITSSCWM